MNKLYLDLLTDKKNKRLVILLDYLVKSRHPSTIEELADVVNVSIKTLKKRFGNFRRRISRRGMACEYWK